MHVMDEFLSFFFWGGGGNQTDSQQNWLKSLYSQTQEHEVIYGI